MTRIGIETAPTTLDPFDARFRAEADFLQVRNAFHGKPVRWRSPGAIPDRTPLIIALSIEDAGP